ncbi:MAG TPA: hypothetical protein VMC09_03165 [Anaerolineales bacterium]|nr:hypothetical protein [Anaerolineales bacterium]
MAEELPRPTRSPWKPLYVTGAVAALLAVFVFRRNLSAELLGLRQLGIQSFGMANVPTGMPVHAADWFALFQHSPYVGLILLNVFDLVEYALVGLMFLAVGAALWNTRRSAVLVATVCGLAGIIVYFASNQAFAMLSLSRQYASAAGEAQRTSLLAAGEMALAVNNPGALTQGTGIYVCMLLVPLAGLILSIAMLTGKVFNRATAVTGILANALILGYFPALAFAPALLILPFVLSAPLRVAWYFLVALKLFQLAKDAKTQ